MKWKITGRFLIAIIVTITISLFAFLIINLFRINNYNMNSSNIASERRGPDFTLEFGENIEYENGDIFIQESQIEDLKKHDNWIQILDENGTEIYSRFKPEEAPAHYTPGKLIFYHKYPGSVGGYTIFVGIINREGKELSYIMGYPSEKISKVQFIYTPETIISDIFKMFFTSLIVISIIALIIGYIFSSFLTKPILGIIEGIQNLSRGKFDEKYKSKGVYNEVYDSLNTLSITLGRNEIEREKTEKMREEWITNITHDIKTPLSSIRGYSEVLLDTDYDISKEEAKKYAQVIKDKSNYISNLVEDLKLTYELNKDNTNIKEKEENLVHILRETIISILNNPQYENRHIDYQPIKEEIIFKGDYLLLQRAFTNLIYNALIHNPEDTNIQVRIKEEKDIIIEIEDNGKGIYKEDLDKLFDRYYRGTNTGEAHKGSGLGMAIAKEIIEHQGGNIEVISKLEKGTMIRIHFK
ncbi:HAMP domain-containing histidine kinase [Clostridium sp. D2Q-11]|uniref:histidine kinase n=1 Tax=Anaeromonas frigoriresistens TaxID=2683708 RepID=A0A942V0H4_9FIRM|nr:HAMP domain-containing sensor histidine kinase [Anaeromonas frigoriresistens]MBS4538932.1 HAMP domain-containing histidine kinase [Anaeromonas frigoriresistens]